jgi:hypothetical protein
MIAAPKRSSVFGPVVLILSVLALGPVCTGVAQATDPAKYGIESLGAGLSTTQAGAHPDFTTTIELKTDPAGPTRAGVNPPWARTRDLSVTVPPGLLGNPENFPQCTTVQLGSSPANSHCPQNSQVGVTEVTVYEIESLASPVYLMKPSAGSNVVAKIGFFAGTFPVVLNIRLRPEEGYALEAKLEGANSRAPLVRAETTLWGVPGAATHDSQRLTMNEAFRHELPPGGGRASGLAPASFMTNPTQCGVVREIKAAASSYQLPDLVAVATAPLPSITGCGKLTFAPQFSLSPTTNRADSPSGIDAELTLPQEGLRQPTLLATPHLKKAVVTLPVGMSLNPAAANGLGACSEAQIGLVSENPIRFNDADPACPNSAKVGTAQITTPVLPEPLQGSLYLASQSDNPFHTLLSGYLVAQGQGVTLKLAGRFDVDPVSGQITATFDENPEQPFEELKLHFKDGEGGVLTTPNACGTYAIVAVLSPWSALDPANPTAAESASSSSPFGINQGPEGGPCPSGAFAPELQAGTIDPSAGSFSPFILRLTRADGTQRLGGLELTLPPGLTGKLAGIPYCSQAAIAAAAALGQPGQGGAQLLAPSCPAASQLGTVTVGAGSGPSPFFVSTGRVYLAGPYKGASLSLAILTPAVAGPFDLGNVVVRTALRVDPESARITAISDPLPTILHGIPLDLRDLRVNLDRAGFTLNPTSCEPKAFSGLARSESGAVAPLSERFQAASCASLAFAPKLALKLRGGIKRSQNPALSATLTFPRGKNANTASAQVSLPHSEFLDQSHIKTICTRVQFAADSCPAASIYGQAKAITPLLDQPLQGPVYLRSSSHPLPDLVADLNGQIEIALVGRIDSVNGGIRTTFDTTPDAPVSKFTLQMQGGKKGLLVNSTDLCARPNRAKATFAGQNGRRQVLAPVLTISCSAKAKKQKPRRRQAAG